MKRKLIFALLTLTLITLPLLAACSGTSQNETVELRLSTMIPAMASRVHVYEEWAQRINEATDGEVTITVYASGTLTGEKDIVAATESGLCDIGEVVFMDIYPLTNLVTLPFLPLGDGYTTSKIWGDLEEEFPELKAEWEDFHVVFTPIQVGTALHLAEKEARRPEDIKGVKMFASGAMVDVMDEIGAVTVAIEMSDWYTSVDRGLVNGMWMGWSSLHSMDLDPFLPYHTVFPSGVQPSVGKMIMNLDTWNSLSSKAQKAFNDNESWIVERLLEVSNEEDAMAISAMEDAGHTFITLTPEEEEMWFKLAEPINEAHIAEIEAMGLPARAIYEEALRLAEEYN